MSEKRYTQAELDKAIHEEQFKRGRTPAQLEAKRAELQEWQEALNEQEAALQALEEEPVDPGKLAADLKEVGREKAQLRKSQLEWEAELKAAREFAGQAVLTAIETRYNLPLGILSAAADEAEAEEMAQALSETLAKHQEAARTEDPAARVTRDPQHRSSSEIFADHIASLEGTKPPAEKRPGERGKQDAFTEYFKAKGQERQAVQRISKGGQPLDESIPHWPYYRSSKETEQPAEPDTNIMEGEPSSRRHFAEAFEETQERE